MAALSPSAVVAVVGAGTMGAGIAQVAALSGHPVRLLDIRSGAAQQAVLDIGAQLDKLVAKGKLSAASALATRQRLTPVTAAAQLQDAALVIEVIAEDLAAKQSLLREIEAQVRPDCILASNTSSLSITAIAATLARPERLAGMHFFNPAPVMALVEIVSGLCTAAEVAATLSETAHAWGKTPVPARSTPGFIVNRVARPYYGEALRLLNEQAADCATLDACMREAGGFRMGPFELMDLIGNDVNFAVTKSVWSAYFHDPRYTPSLLQQELVEAGRLGRKVGRGWYDHREGAPPSLAQSAPTVARPARIALYGNSVAAQALQQRLLAAQVAHECLSAQPDARIAQVDEAVLYVTDGRSATQRGADNACPNTVLIDLALDYTQATRLALACAHGCTAPARASAIGLLQAAGLAVSELRDVPALTVMRTVAMLANEAADAVNQGVCDAPGADAAMRLGVNYPLGPLAWAAAVGLPVIIQVLAHLGQCYGEDRYRISPWLQQQAHSLRTPHDASP